MAKTEPIKKSYENLDFLHSAAARPIRILCEMIEPQERFDKHEVNNTIVFFGSARALPIVEARKNLADLEQRGVKPGQSSSQYEREIESAKCQVKMGQYYQDAQELAHKLTEWSMEISNPSKRFIICSGGGPGMMEAANRGAHQAGGLSSGLNISLPEEQDPNPYQTRDISFEFHYFFIRKFWFFYLAKALVVFPGGFGTLDELFELLTLVQTEKTKKYMPILIYGREYWDELINFDAMIKWNTIAADDMKLFHIVDDVDTAFELLKEKLTHIYLKGGKRKK